MFKIFYDFNEYRNCFETRAFFSSIKLVFRVINLYSRPVTHTEPIVTAVLMNIAVETEL